MDTGLVIWWLAAANTVHWTFLCGVAAGNQFWERLLLLLTDPHKRHVVLQHVRPSNVVNAGLIVPGCCAWQSDAHLEPRALISKLDSGPCTVWYLTFISARSLYGRVLSHAAGGMFFMQHLEHSQSAVTVCINSGLLFMLIKLSRDHRVVACLLL